MRIQHNPPAYFTLIREQDNRRRLTKSLEKLSSGYQITRAADNAGGLAISEKMRGQIRGLAQAKENSMQGVSVVQTAEGALSECHSILQRMRELSVQSMNGVYQKEDRLHLDQEYQQLITELDRIASSTHFNKINLLDGSLKRDGGGPARMAPRNEAAGPAAVAAIAAGLPAAPPVGGAAALAASPTVISGTNAAIAADGVYVLAAGFTGTVTIAAGANVTLTQTGGTSLQNVSIQCGTGTALTIQDLNINNSADQNAIHFEGAGNSLHVEGNNRITSSATPIYHSAIDDFDTVDAAVIHAGAGTELTIDGAGALTAETSGGRTIGTRPGGGTSILDGQNCAVIGGNSGESGGSITINSGSITAVSRAGGAAIGGGIGGSGGNITINGGTVNASSKGRLHTLGAAIGSGVSGVGG